MFFLAILILAASTTPDTNESDVAPQFCPLVSKDIYTGSLNILLFSKGMVSPVIQSRMGNQIAIIDMGSLPAN